jgi:hypothetical protein
MRGADKFVQFVLWSVVALALLAVYTAQAGDLPDPQITPGALSPEVVRDVTLDELCHSSTSLVRNVPSKVKNVVFAEYGLHQEHRPDCTGPGHACFEIDHECSLELGCNNDIKNLWPQAYDGTEWNAHVKDKLEDRLHAMICAPNPTMTVSDAQQCISTDWIACYKEIFP